MVWTITTSYEILIDCSEKLLLNALDIFKCACLYIVFKKKPHTTRIVINCLH